MTFSGFVWLLCFQGLPFFYIMRFYIFLNSQFFFTYIFVYFQVFYIFHIFRFYYIFYILKFSIFSLLLCFSCVLYFEFPLPSSIGFLSKKRFIYRFKMVTFRCLKVNFGTPTIFEIYKFQKPLPGMLGHAWPYPSQIIWSICMFNRYEVGCTKSILYLH